jgi:hypothetical protein
MKRLRALALIFALSMPVAAQAIDAKSMYIGVAIGSALALSRQHTVIPAAKATRKAATGAARTAARATRRVVGIGKK